MTSQPGDHRGELVLEPEHLRAHRREPVGETGVAAHADARCSGRPRAACAAMRERARARREPASARAIGATPGRALHAAPPPCAAAVAADAATTRACFFALSPAPRLPAPRAPPRAHGVGRRKRGAAENPGHRAERGAGEKQRGRERQRARPRPRQLAQHRRERADLVREASRRRRSSRRWPSRRRARRPRGPK